MAGKREKEDSAMSRIRDRFERSGLTLHDLGLRMGYSEETARKSAWQFIQKTEDPRLSMLRRFAEAMEIDVKELLSDEMK